MKRSEFLRKLILTSVAVPLAPELIDTINETNNFDVIEAVKAQILNTTFQPNVIYFKVTAGMLKDQSAFDLMIEQKEIDLNRKIESIFSGWENDDFLKNQFTVELKFKPI